MNRIRIFVVSDTSSPLARIICELTGGRYSHAGFKMDNRSFEARANGVNWYDDWDREYERPCVRLKMWELKAGDCHAERALFTGFTQTMAGTPYGFGQLLNVGVSFVLRRLGIKSKMILRAHAVCSEVVCRGVEWVEAHMGEPGQVILRTLHRLCPDFDKTYPSRFEDWLSIVAVMDALVAEGLAKVVREKEAR